MIKNLIAKNTSLFFAVTLLVSQTLLSDRVFAAYTIPPDNNVIIPMSTQYSEKYFPNKFRFAVWNTEKGKKEQRWLNDMDAMKSEFPLILMQEGMRDPQMQTMAQNYAEFGTTIAQSFLYDDGTASGVLTMSKVKPVKESFVRSPDLEPVINTPKMTLFSTFELQSGTQILFVNLHGINFVTGSAFENQVNAVAAEMAKFAGPVVFAGDFNTWSASRTKFLVDKMTQMGFVHAVFQNDYRLHPELFSPIHSDSEYNSTAKTKVLDHIFVKGCKIAAAELEAEYEYSDHFAFSADLDCP